MDKVRKAIDKLSKEYKEMDFQFDEVSEGDRHYCNSRWPGEEAEQIMVCVAQDMACSEPFHRQDYYFIHYAYENGYVACSDAADHFLTICENECYIGQPFNGYALCGNKGQRGTIISVLLRKDTFVKELMPAISNEFSLFHFFLDPEKDPYLDGYIHLGFEESDGVRRILELMVIEYAERQKDTQSILKSLTLVLLMMIAREYGKNMRKNPRSPLTYRIIEYMNNHFGAVTLKDVAMHFSYHPNYISALLHRETGHTFSEHLLESRMRSALALLNNSKLSIEEVACICGYKNNSGFYRAFRSYYGVPPREYAKRKGK